MLSKPYLRLKLSHEAVVLANTTGNDQVRIGYDDELHLCVLQGPPKYAVILSLFSQLYFDQETPVYSNGAVTFLCKEELFRKGLREMTKDNVFGGN